MSNSTYSRPKATYKLNIYLYKIDSTSQMLVVCHDRLPFIIGKAQLINSEYENEDCKPVAEMIPLLEKNETIYENFINSIPDSDSNKIKYQNSFAEDLRKEFFLIKTDTGLIDMSKEYIIRGYDRYNNKNLLISNNINGVRIKANSFMEVYSFFVSINEERAQKQEEQTCGSICKRVCITLTIIAIIRIILEIIFEIINN